MEVSQMIVNVNSEQPEKLTAFYADVVGLPKNPDMGETAFMAGGTPFLIDGHSNVRGPAGQPERVLLNFFVDDAAAEQKRLEAKGVKFIRSGGREAWGGIISTFTDPDGNYLQLIEYKP